MKGANILQTGIARALVALGVLVVLALVAYGYALNRVGALQETIAASRADLVFETDREFRLRSIEQLVAETEDEQGVLRGLFVIRDGVVSMISRIEGLGPIAGVALETTSVSVDDPDEEGFGFLRVRIETVGTWSELLHLLTLIEALPWAIDVNQAVLTHAGAGEESPWDGIFSVQVLMLDTPLQGSE